MKFMQFVLFTLTTLAVSRECSILQPKRASRIRRIENGDSICIKNVPYHVTIKVHGSYKCGGALIKSNWVLTAAHCVLSTLITKSNLIVVAGTDSMKLYPGHSFIDRSIERASEHIEMHPFYAKRLGNKLGQLGATAVNDLALIKLAKEFPINDRIKPINLPREDVEINDELLITGAGRIDSETKSSCLRFYKPKVVDCYPFDKIRDIFCHKDKLGNKKTHVGDSGGPLVNIRNELVGIHQGTLTSEWAMFQKATNVYYYSDWIYETIEKWQRESNDLN